MRGIRILLVAVVGVILAGCASTAAPAAGGSAPGSTGGGTSTGAATPDNLQKVTVGLGYIPNVQFAPFYVAVRKGYYAAEGLDVEFSHGATVNELLVQAGAGTLPFVMASGDEVLLARGQGVPVKMVFLMYQKMPVAIFSKQGAGIATPADLRGKTIGLPGRYGATYIGLRGLLYANNMREEDVNLSEIGFTQFEAVKQDRVPAAVGFANNEPLRLRESGEAINVLEVSEYIELVNNGLVVGETLLEEQPELVRAFVRATRRGLADTLANPDEAFKLALSYIPELAAEQQPFERKVLEATLGYWQTAETEREGLGWPNPQAWEVTSRFLRETELLRTDTPPEQAYSLDFYR